jgi:hypothetical protein
VRDLRAVVVGLVVGAALLSGCSQKVEASDTLPSTGASASSGAELPPLGPPDLPMPRQAREQTPEGAQAFTEYYVEIYNHALRTLDTTYLHGLSSGCDTCDQLAGQLERASARGQGIEGGEMRIVGSTRPYLHGDLADLVFDIAQAPILATQGGNPIQGRSYPGSESSGGGGILRWDDDRRTWVFTQWNA